MANSTQAAAAAPAEVLKNIPMSESCHITYITVDVSSYAVGGFPRMDTPPSTPDKTSSFKKFFEFVHEKEVGHILLVGIVSGAAVVARYDDVLDRIKLYQVDDATGLLEEVANAVDVGDVRLWVMHT